MTLVCSSRRGETTKLVTNSWRVEWMSWYLDVTTLNSWYFTNLELQNRSSSTLGVFTKTIVLFHDEASCNTQHYHNLPLCKVCHKLFTVTSLKTLFSCCIATKPCTRMVNKPTLVLEGRLYMKTLWESPNLHPNQPAHIPQCGCATNIYFVEDGGERTTYEIIMELWQYSCMISYMVMHKNFKLF
jgi:hypothetical protein